MSDFADITSDVVDWLRCTLPLDLPSDVGCYIIPRKDAPHLWGGRGGGDDVGGHLISTSYTAVAEHLRDVGQWQNHGFAFMLESDRVPPTFAAIRNLALHELCHYVEFEATDPEPPPAQGFPLESAERIAATQFLYAEVTQPSYKPWYDHGPEFIRLMLHAWHRCHLAGWPLWLGDIWAAGSSYGLSHLREYLAVLEIDGELQRLEGMSLTDVAREPIPQLFSEFFETDSLRTRR